jgi:hypothetical protein
VRALELAGFDRDRAALVVGHERGFTFRVYNPEGLNLTMLRDVIELVRYPGLEVARPGGCNGRQTRTVPASPPMLARPGAACASCRACPPWRVAWPAESAGVVPFRDQNPKRMPPSTLWL